MKKLLISFSGGRTSAYMTWWLLNIWKDRGDYEMVVIFANTGREREETLQFVDDCDTNFGFKTIWIESEMHEYGTGATAKVIDFNSASRNGEPFEGVIKKHGIPNQNAPHCPKELKRNPIRSYAKNELNWKKYFTAIGIRTDEVDRMNANFRKEKIFYPLISVNPTTKSDINLFWSKQSFDLQLKSYEGNCKDCWKKSLRKLLTIAKEDPLAFEWTKEMEEKYGNFVPESRKETSFPPFRFFRNNLLAQDIIEKSKTDFVAAKDESKDIDMYKQIGLFDDLDNAFGCIESCEAF